MFTTLKVSKSTINEYEVKPLNDVLAYLPNDYDKSSEILLRENYFFLNGYRSPFLINGTKRFIDGTTFEELYALFTFDRYFRNIILIWRKFFDKKFPYKEMVKKDTWL